MENKAIDKQKMIEDAKRGVLSKFPLLGSVVSGVEFRDVGDAMPTAATDGEKIIYNGEFVTNLSYDERVGVFAHEIMHIAFNHILRSKDKDGRLWNIATDSVINQMLRDEGVKLPDGTVDMPEAQNRSAEDMYDKILEEMKKRQQDQAQHGQGSASQDAQSGGANAQDGAQPSSQNDTSNDSGASQNDSTQGENSQGQSSDNQSAGAQSQNGNPQNGNNQNGDNKSDNNQENDSQNGGAQRENSNSQNGSSQSGGNQNGGNKDGDLQNGGAQGEDLQDKNNNSQGQNSPLQGQGGQNGGTQGGGSGGSGSQGGMSSQKPQGGKGLPQGQNKGDNFDLDKVLGGKAFDSHDIWKDAVEKAEKREQAEKDEQNKQVSSKNVAKEKGAQAQNKDEQAQQNEDSIQDFEREFVEQNRKKKEQIARKIIDDLANQRTDARGAGTQTYSLGAVGKAKAAVSWKKVLKKELDKEDDRWSYRRASDENDYQARIGYLQVEDKPKTEVILDVSGSISEGLLRAFLRQIKMLVDDSELKVGTFSDDFWGWQKVKSKKEIDKIAFHMGGCTNYDAASRAFSKERGTNHIVFTDGDYGDPIINKRNDIIWISFVNRDFKPDFGKVIYVSPEEIRATEHLHTYDPDREL